LSSVPRTAPKGRCVVMTGSTHTHTYRAHPKGSCKPSLLCTHTPTEHTARVPASPPSCSHTHPQNTPQEFLQALPPSATILSIGWSFRLLSALASLSQLQVSPVSMAKMFLLPRSLRQGEGGVGSSEQALFVAPQFQHDYIRKVALRYCEP
jgi:hypothetical protein